MWRGIAMFLGILAGIFAVLCLISHDTVAGMILILVFVVLIAVALPERSHQTYW